MPTVLYSPARFSEAWGVAFEVTPRSMGGHVGGRNWLQDVGLAPVFWGFPLCFAFWAGSLLYCPSRHWAWFPGLYKLSEAK